MRRCVIIRRSGRDAGRVGRAVPARLPRDARAARQPDVEFAVRGARRLTYREAPRPNGSPTPSSPRDCGRRPIAVLAKNCVEYPLVYFGASRVGVVPALLNYRSAPPEGLRGGRRRARGCSSSWVGSTWTRSTRSASRWDRPSASSRWAPRPEKRRRRRADRLRGLDRRAAGRTSRRAGHARSARTTTCTSSTRAARPGQPKGAVLSQRAVVANLRQIGQCAHRGEPGRAQPGRRPDAHAEASSGARWRRSPGARRWSSWRISTPPRWSGS